MTLNLAPCANCGYFAEPPVCAKCGVPVRAPRFEWTVGRMREVACAYGCAFWLEPRKPLTIERLSKGRTYWP